MPTESIFLSLCMIVKNEESVLERCLSSVQRLVDEIIIVDTGSSDGTKAIAKSFTTKVFDYNWDNNFSNARNYSIEQARGEWILVLDADEVLIHKGKTELIDCLRKSSAEGYYLTIVNILEEGPNAKSSKDSVVRIFRNNKEYMFTGSIHEQVKHSIIAKAGTSALAELPLTIMHEGYTAKALKAKQKVLRNTEIIKISLRTSPKDPFLLYSLGCEYLQIGDLGLALQEFQSALYNLPPSESYLPDLVAKTAFCLYQLHRMEEFSATIQTYSSLVPQCPELALLVAQEQAKGGKYNEAEKLLQACLQDLPAGAGSSDIGRFQIYQALAELQEAQGHYPEALELYYQATQAKPNYLFPLARIIRIYKEFPDSLPPIAKYLNFCSVETQFALLNNLNMDVDVDLVIFLVFSSVKEAITLNNEQGLVLLNGLISILDNRPEHSQRLTAVFNLLKATSYLMVIKPVAPHTTLRKLLEDFQTLLLGRDE